MSKSFLISLLFPSGTGSGDVRELTQEQILNWQPAQGILWLHLNYRNPDARQLLMGVGVSKVDTETLLSADSRPRVLVTKERMLMTLRGVNVNPDSDPEDMVAVRLYADECRIITSSDRKVRSLAELAEQLLKGGGPTRPGSFILAFCRSLTLKKVTLIYNLEDKLADLEDQVLQQSSAEIRTELADLRRKIITLRRYLIPQKEAFFEVINTPSLLTQEDKINMRDNYNTLIRVIEDLDGIRDQAVVTQEELSNQLTEQLNKRLYFLSLITGIFFPLSFLTGLLGVNIGGIPGVHDPQAFAWFCLGLMALLVIQVALLYSFRWLKH
ncbi:zinc transporter ZntB [Photobacterium nomapromontoriensis]|uniref:zinc transporter ZntB n=1 Tax=Photobacterium nomapromontoriensis TaxID=2910237 RepID=UPI003D0E78C6